MTTPMSIHRNGILNQYADRLPITGRTPRLSLCEGNTPLIPAPYLSDLCGFFVYLKFEGANPTGSFKDRGMVLAVAKALEASSGAVICASTGNTSAAAAAYAARAGIRSIVIIPDGYVALGKLAQAFMYGAQVVAIRGNFDQALALVRELAETESVTLVNSVNPFRLEGQKTAAFEVNEALGRSPDYLAIPVGNAGNISAYFKGFLEDQERAALPLPHMLGFQAAGAAPIVRQAPVAKPETVATAIRIGNPTSWSLATDALKRSNGLIDAVSDEEILAAQRLLAQKEGVFAEPASAASVAGLLKSARTGSLPRTRQTCQGDAIAVCVLTGSGLKDPDTAVRSSQGQALTVNADRTAVWRAVLEGRA
jgi:threonine synthase